MEYKISIIIPVYNAEKYIKKSLDSIIKQTIGFEHLEVIMVDDGSTDSSGEIMDEYAAEYENFKSIHLQENSGAAGKPKNCGLDHATAEYLMFLDADDYYNDDACEVLYNEIKKSNVDIVSGNYIYVYGNRTEKFEDFQNEVMISIKKIDENPSLLTLPPAFWAKIYRKKFIFDKGIRFVEGIPNEDLIFVVNSFLEAKGIVYLSNHYAVNYSRQTELDGVESVSRNRAAKNLKRTVEGYHETFIILKKYKKEKYFSLVFKGHLQFWTNNFIASDATYHEKAELLKDVGILFEKLDDLEMINNEYLRPFFISVSNKEYDKAISIAESLKPLLSTHKSLQNQLYDLQNQLEYVFDEKNNLENQLILTKKTLSKHLTTLGYMKYKSKNIFSRTNSRIKKNLLELNLLYKKIKYEFSEYNPTVNFKKLTIIIPYRKTNNIDRKVNLDITLRYLSKIGISNLIISEHADNSMKDFLTNQYSSLFKNFKVIYTNSEGKLFNISKAINVGAVNSKTPYISFHDIDCLTKKKNIIYAVNLLRDGYEVVHPFDRRVTNIVDKNKFKKDYDFNSIDTEEQNRPWADGGIVFWNKKSFISVGMLNEYFAGWGGEDNEIMLRADLLGLKQFRIEDTLYHLYHYRPQIRTQNNVVQLERTRKFFDKKSCLEEVNKWPWVIEAKNKFY